jgi:hypothetical protein
VSFRSLAASLSVQEACDYLCVRAGQDARYGCLRGPGVGGLWRYAHDDGTGDGGADGGLADAAGACRRRGGGPSEGVCGAPGRGAAAEGAGCHQGPDHHPRLCHAGGRRFLLACTGQPQEVLAWAQAHLPRRFTPEDADFGPPSWDRTFSLTTISGVLNARDLVVEVAGVGNGDTAIRVDAQMSWQPPRPALEQASPAARMVTITQLPSLDPLARRPPAPVTISDLAVVRGLAALVDSLQLSTIGPGAPCPLSADGGIRLTFLARIGGPPLAVAQGPAACGTVQFSVGARQQPALQITDTFIPRVLMLADLHWKLP